MALPVNRIGDERFIALNGESQSIAKKVELYSRPGVNGLQAVQTGERGQPFVLRSTIDLADMAAGHDKYRTYQAMIGTTKPLFTVHDVDVKTRDNVVVLVLDVQKTMLHKFVKMVGGLNPNSKVMLVCEWQLVLLANTSN